MNKEASVQCIKVVILNIVCCSQAIIGYPIKISFYVASSMFVLVFVLFFMLLFVEMKLGPIFLIYF